MLKPPSGCPFAPRCPHAMAQCSVALPPLFEPEPGQLARCWLHHPEAPRVDTINSSIEVVA